MSDIGRHRALLMAIPFAVAVALRVYPYLFYGVPYSTDSWSPIRNAEVLLQQTPTQLGGNPAFDGYNIYWPANSIFGAVASLVFGVAPVKVMPLLFPAVASVTVIVFFLVAEEITGSSIAASIAALFLATAGVDAIFTAAVTKETYAEPLFMVSVLLLLWKADRRTASLFAITSFALALSHHATSVLFLVVAGSVVAVDSILRRSRGESLGRRPLLLAAGGAITLAYFLGYADAGLGQLESLITVQSALFALAFLTLFLSPVAYHAVSRPTRLLLAEGGFVLALCVGVLAVGTSLTLIPTAPVVGTTLLVSAAPYVLGGALAVMGYRYLHASRDRSDFAFVAPWLASLLALGFLAVFSGVPNGLAIVYRLLAFVGAPAMVLASLTLHRLLGSPRWSRALKFAVVVLVVAAICVPSAYQTYGAAIQKQGILGGEWAYQQSDLSGAEWIGAMAPAGNFTVAGDLRMQYIVTDYIGVQVNVSSGYGYLEHPSVHPRPAYLVTYSMMQSDGYVNSFYGSRLPRNWSSVLSQTAPILFENGDIVLW